MAFENLSAKRAIIKIGLHYCPFRNFIFLKNSYLILNLALIFRKIGDEISIMKIKQDCHFSTAPREKLHLRELSELFFSKFKMSYFYV